MNIPSLIEKALVDHFRTLTLFYPTTFSTSEGQSQITAPHITMEATDGGDPEHPKQRLFSVEWNILYDPSQMITPPFEVYESGIVGAVVEAWRTVDQRLIIAGLSGIVRYRFTAREKEEISDTHRAVTYLWELVIQTAPAI